MCLLRINLPKLCPNMIYVDALDFNEWHSEEVISFFWRSVSQCMSKMNAIDEIVLLSRAQLLWPTNLKCSWRKRVTKARNWMTMFQNWSTKDEFEGIKKLLSNLDLSNQEPFERMHIPESPGRNWKDIFWNWMKRWRKWAGKPIIYFASFVFPISRPFYYHWFLFCTLLLMCRNKITLYYYRSLCWKCRNKTKAKLQHIV